MENNLEFTVKENEQTLKIINRQFDIDWDKLQTLEDVKSLLKAMQMHVFFVFRNNSRPSKRMF